MPATRLRTDAPADAPSAKRVKTSHLAVPDGTDFIPYFASGLLEDTSVDSLNADYRQSGPFQHAVIDKLFQDDLLTKVKDECIGELSFTEKETDIYKVNQTGDLASLSFLAEAQIALLPNLLKLRDALYSPAFRAFLRKVTGCGPLSGVKQDMSVNSYKKGCHLLNHDDVIGTRRVSYILYMPLPQTEQWKAEWGGALELYPVRPGLGGAEEPEPIPSKTIPPSWNQFVFFEVQPGHSFHSVEEVVVDEGDCQRQRLSISGWFHKAQEGEEGYEDEQTEKNRSSLEQLTSTTTTYLPYPDNDSLRMPDSFFTPLTGDETSFLSAFLDPVYLQPKVLSGLAKRFVEESSLELHKFLCEPLAVRLEAGLRARDKKDGLDSESRAGRVPPHGSGFYEGAENVWTLRGPPHKARYCTLSSTSVAPKSGEDTDYLTIISSPKSTPEQILRVLQDTLFPSLAFRSWLAIVAKLCPLHYAVEARRFRPGLDYTLATSNDEQSILDVVLGVTPELVDTERNGKNGSGEKGKTRARDQEEDEEPTGWEKGDWGGWECYMAPHEGEEDPAVYRSGSSKKITSESLRKDEENKRRNIEDGNADSLPTNKSGSVDTAAGGANDIGTESGDEYDQKAPFESSDSDDDEGDVDDDSTLLTVQPGFNRLMLALRDEGVMHFVKYVSAGAPGSRWDVCGEYEVFMAEIEDEDAEEEKGGVE
ncbi:hypothetical protein M0805_006085 [Coniferiporia weirii]|nr:hypothetical protein M0805_006085 [Coniferiporia weirii]